LGAHCSHVENADLALLRIAVHEVLDVLDDTAAWVDLQLIFEAADVELDVQDASRRPWRGC
jgi:hypothetical protein